MKSIIPKMRISQTFPRTMLILLLCLAVYHIIYRSQRPNIYLSKITGINIVNEDSYVARESERELYLMRKSDYINVIEKTTKSTLSKEVFSHPLKKNVTDILRSISPKLKLTSFTINPIKEINSTQQQLLEFLTKGTLNEKWKNGNVNTQSKENEALQPDTIASSKKTATVPGVTRKDNGNVPTLDNTLRQLEHRAEIVRQMCNKWNMEEGETSHRISGKRKLERKEKITLSHFYLARSASTMTCPINKTEAEFHFARKYFFKFLLVRHPFERLLSAYRDKIERANHWSLLQFRKHILSSLSPKQIETGTKSTAIEQEGEAGIETNKANEDIPTFSDFLEYILRPNLTDADFSSHWAPYWQWCSPCTINYTVIAKLETAAGDLEYIWHRVGLHTPESPWHNRISLGSSTKPTVLSHYYRQLDPSLIRRVYQRYRPDFEIFQYDVREVFRLANHCLLSDCSDVGDL
ncbi:carbohydrate sulfotransferase 12-like [Penaeus japonicus]|uniref:carbohydrate sulfotransferase 12-like n=1 Tax=Penaeus japonicus TaxID=27405 RepID=UPI001C713167|nr:carbohydrate sulfotransferase 12-like [Penaeus japonicus]XP_042870723.1 carbohydrate sulfotransferase 12-like [Penaeus japonicus]